MKLTQSLVVLLICFITIAFSRPNIDRIFGGHDAVPNSAPYIVSIQWQYNTLAPVDYLCSGTILNEGWILTAAECVPTWGITTIIAGEHDFNIDEGIEQISSASGKPIVHWMYHPPAGFGPYDIALVRLSKKFIFNDFVQPISLPAFNSIPTGETTFYGWGGTPKNETVSNILQTADRPIITVDECRKSIENNWGDRVHETNFCTGPVNAAISACKSDKGGPVIQMISGKPVLVGITSWGSIVCGRGPTVNVRVSAFIDWIDENMIN